MKCGNRSFNPLCVCVSGSVCVCVFIMPFSDICFISSVSPFQLQLLLVAIVAARFGGSSSRATRASSTVLAAESPQNNIYGNSNGEDKQYNDNKNIDGVTDSRRAGPGAGAGVNNAADNNDNDNYNYNKALAKWHGLPQQKLYANPQGAHGQRQQQQHEQQQQQQGQFADDPEAARNDFLLQLPDLNADADAAQGVGLFVSYNNKQQEGNSNNNNNYSEQEDYNNVKDYDNDSDNNVWQVAASALERASDGEYAPQLKRSSRR